MSDEPAKLILGDTAISALEEHPNGKRGFFGRRRRQRAPLTHCENCGAQLTGRYCAQCGQAAVDYRRSFRHVIIDVLDSFLNWDSKFIATIGLLITKPWRLTNEFLAGKRVRYVHPLRLYLLASILFFFAVNYGAKSIPATKLSDKDRAEIQAELKNENLAPEVRDKIEKALKTESPSPEAGKTGEASKGKDTAPAPDAKTEDGSKKEENRKNHDDFGPSLQLGPDKPSTLGKWFEQRAKEKFGEHGANAKAFIITLINNLPGMMLCCVPLFAFVLKILYLRRRIFYIDHLIYALHIHTFAYVGIMLIGFATMGLNRTAPNLVGWMSAILWTTFAVQIFLSIRRVYQQGWFFTLFKFFAGGVVYLIVLGVAFAATFFITLALPTS